MADQFAQPVVIGEFKKCPNPLHKADGLGDRFVFEEIAKEEKAKGKIGEHMQFGLPVAGIITDIRKNVLTAPQITVIYDVCMDCGMMFAKTILRQEKQLNETIAKPGQRPGGPFITR